MQVSSGQLLARTPRTRPLTFGAGLLAVAGAGLAATAVFGAWGVGAWLLGTAAVVARSLRLLRAIPLAVEEAELALRAGATQRAVDSLEPLAVRFTAMQQPDLYIALGTAYLAAGNVETAAATFELALGVRPLQAAHALSYCLAVEGRLDDARALVDADSCCHVGAAPSLARLALLARDNQWDDVIAALPPASTLSGATPFTYVGEALGSHPARAFELLVAFARQRQDPDASADLDVAADEFAYLEGRWEALASFVRSHAVRPPSESRPRRLPRAVLATRR